LEKKEKRYIHVRVGIYALTLDIVRICKRYNMRLKKTDKIQ
jgi:hypothetical protein